MAEYASALPANSKVEKHVGPVMIPINKTHVEVQAPHHVALLCIVPDDHPVNLVLHPEECPHPLRFWPPFDVQRDHAVRVF